MLVLNAISYLNTPEHALTVIHEGLKYANNTLFKF